MAYVIPGVSWASWSWLNWSISWVEGLIMASRVRSASRNDMSPPMASRVLEIERTRIYWNNFPKIYIFWILNSQLSNLVANAGKVSQIIDGFVHANSRVDIKTDTVRLAPLLFQFIQFEIRRLVSRACAIRNHVWSLNFLVLGQSQRRQQVAIKNRMRSGSCDPQSSYHRHRWLTALPVYLWIDTCIQKLPS